jgi:HSP20 family protein
MTQNGKVALVRRGNVALAKRMESLEEYMMPAVDIYETPDAFVLKADMPGVLKESISICAEPGVLHIKGTITQMLGEDVNVLYSEIRKSNYFRKFNIGNGIDGDNIEASVNDGVLTILLPKNESMRVREIPIK